MRYQLSMRTIALAVLVAVPAGVVPAQEPPRAAALRRELEVRFAQQIRQQLQLSDEAAGRIGTIMSGYAERRRQLEADERRFRTGLNQQLRPGIAANSDSVTAYVEGIAATRVEYARLVQEEMSELGTVLTPVQRGQLFLMRDRLLQRVQELRDARMGPRRPPL